MSISTTISHALDIIYKLYEKLNPILPYFIMMGAISGNNLIILIAIPLIAEFIQYLCKIYMEYHFGFRLEIYEYPRNDKKKYNKNLFFKCVTFLLEHHSLLAMSSKIMTDTTYYNGNRKIEVGDDVYGHETPFILPMPDITIPFKHRNCSVDITLTNKLSKTSEGQYNVDNKYVITSKRKSDINNFLEYLTELQITMLNIKNSDIKIPSLFEYVKSEFVANFITINKRFQNIFIEKDIKENIINQLSCFINGKHYYDKFGLAYRIGYLFYGTPGNGKSSLIFAIANEFNRDIYKINLNISCDEFRNEIKSVKRNSIVVFEDIDTCHIAQKRNYLDNAATANYDNKKNKKTKLSESFVTLSDLLYVLDGYCHFHGCIIIMTTNYIDKLDPALIRSGRIDHKIELTNVTSDRINDIIHFYFGRPFSKKRTCFDNGNHTISTSELINSIIMPNINNYDAVYNYLMQYSENNNYGSEENKCGSKIDNYGSENNNCGSKIDNYGSKENKSGSENNNYGSEKNKCGSENNNYGSEENKCYSENNNYGSEENKCGFENNNYGSEENKSGSKLVHLTT